MQIDATNAANHTDFISLCPLSIAAGATVEQVGRKRENWGRLGPPRHTHSSKRLEPNGMKPMRRSERSDAHSRPARSVTRRVLLAVLAAVALVAAPIGSAARSCILSSTPAEQPCKPACCANKTCCVTANEHKSTPTQPLGKADSNYKVSATSVALFLAISPSRESGAQTSLRSNAAFAVHSPPMLALICIRLI